MSPLWTGWTLGLMLGVMHAFEPDHLAAVATLVSTKRRHERASWLGAWWGIGHAAMLLLVGGALVALRLTMPARVASMFEAGVAILLLALGARSLVVAARAWRSGPSHAHQHGHHHHTHGGPPDHVHVAGWTLARRPLLVGIAHGLAGSGALTTLALAAMPSLSSALVYLALFSVGSVAAMAVAAGLLGWPLGRLARDARLQCAFAGAAGTFSLALGIHMLVHL